MAGTTLCVVDMQPGFNACYSIVQETVREIRLAKKRGDGIVFIELHPRPNGKTLSRLKEVAHAGGYKKIVYTKKNWDDGSLEFIDAAGAAGWFPLKRVRVCGVNRGACVMSTVKGLIDIISKNVKIELAYEATAPGTKKWAEDESNEKLRYLEMVNDGNLIIK
jgi:hypothetical protein